MTTSTIADWLNDYASVIHDKADYLTDLDREIGDADHGANMNRGMQAVIALDPQDFADAGAYLKKAGMTLVSTVGGASGPLYGTFFLRAGGALADNPCDTAHIAEAFRAGLDGLSQRGKAVVGDKTLVDALTPAVESLESAAENGTPLAQALKDAADAAHQGADSTVDTVAHKGRASYLGERSQGHLDPGAASVTLLIESAARTLA